MTMTAKELLELINKAKEAEAQLEAQYLKEFGENLAACRKKTGMTQDELAQKLGLSRTSITNMEVGKQDTMLSRIPYLCAALNCTITDLIPSI